ncbi:hypothetical protein BU15DRAFT_76749 [Melanogaster broomeanus]|nr:hypothetical protein BU15DRAFT_76749 [Melanogaster broomeanus]
MESTTPRSKETYTTEPHRLNPVTSLSTSRYNRSCYIQVCPRIISKGPTPRGSSSSASGWRRLIHPEGQPYFVLHNQEFPVVTEANLEEVETEAQILESLSVVKKELHCHDIKVPLRCELFLELDEDRSVCNYYFVDHDSKALFWLEDICTELLDIPAATSPSHLDTALEKFYWVHVEFFPMHHEPHVQGLSHIVDDLSNIISHGQADRLTSRTSTFPYTAETCEQFLRLLSRKSGQPIDGHTLCYAARLAGAIANQRFITFYGQQSAQLDRLQEMYPGDVLEHRWLSTVANLMLWGIPGHYNTLLEDLYVNEQVYADQWTHFMSLCLVDWTTSMSWTLPVLIASILLANVRGGTISTAIPTVVSCGISIASASSLHLRHSPLAESSASMGARYLRQAKSTSVGFLPSAVVFSFPRATYMWAIGFLFAQFLFVASRSVSKLVALVAASFLAVLLLFILWVISPEEPGVVSLFRSLSASYVAHMYSRASREDESMA